MTAVSIFSTETFLALCSFVLIAGYHLFFWIEIKRHPERTVIGVARRQRAAWVATMQAQKDGILAVQTLRNSVMISSFLASTAVLISIGLLGIAVSIDKISSLVHEINILGNQSVLFLTVKIFVMILIYFTAFFNFSMSLRFYNYAAISINIDDKYHQKNDSIFPGKYMELGARHFSIGMRLYYLSIPILVWAFGPIWLLASSSILVLVLYRHDHIESEPPLSGGTS